jgi:hypothetical protein
LTTRQRLDLLARAYPQLFPRPELTRLLRTQLGHVDALDGWIKRDGTRVRAWAPRLIYHICAGNLAVSAFTSIAHGLLLGVQNAVKLPGDRDDSTTRTEILRFIKDLPAPLRKLVKAHRALDPKILRQADAVIAFGSDATMASLRAQTRWDQKFIAHGHALSLLWIAEPANLTPSLARNCAIDVLTYDQLGCLSPQAIYVPRGTNISLLGSKLATALEQQWKKIQPKPGRQLSVAARICEARDVAHALGHRVWLPLGNHLGWTLIHDPDPTFQPSPLHGVIYLRQVTESKLLAALTPVAGRISTVGVAGEFSEGRMSSRLQNLFLSLGVSRFCLAGRMQYPPLTWHHEGRPVLADLVTWIDSE